MTTADFIKQTYNTTNTKWSDRHGYERRCSSVFTDKGGTVYSYGYHYPLAFHVAGIDFVNNQGYSSTTAKHVLWAKQAMDYEYIAVKLWRDEAQVISNSAASEEQKLKAITVALTREFKSINEQMAQKTRKNTQVYKHLEDEYERVRQALNSVLEARA